MVNPLGLDFTLGGADSAAALGFPDGRTESYRALKARVLARAEALRPQALVPLPAAPEALLVEALAAWHAGAVAAVSSGPAEASAVISGGAALLLYTSGSTAAPKGVLLSGAGLRANVEAILTYLPVAEVSDTALLLPLHYSYALVGQALTTLHAGGTVWLLDGLPYVGEQLEAISRIGRPVGLSSVPTALRRLAKTQLEAPSRARLGYLASAGGKLSADTVRLVHAAFPGVRLFNQYGLTEASPRVAAISDAHPAFTYGSVGCALPGLEVLALSPSGAPLPPGMTGELAVRGPSVMLGYHRDLEATARVLAPDGTLRTGDLGYVDESGFIYLEGRTDGVVKVAGERVSLAQVGAALGDVELVAVPDEALGTRLVAFVEGDPKPVRDRGRALPPQQRPAKVVSLTAFPRTANGKVDRAALRALAEQS
ncbi:MAG: acyl--CoA ligase [Archangiaceae bacterium]|nr:acyl--CoA ligase [Archangiaceae bacterium]